MKCYWINLEKDVERREKILSEFQNYNIENHRVEGIKHEIPSIGCCLSHIKMIYEAFISSSDSEELIMFMEDDLNISQGIEHIKPYLELFPKDCDILQCHYIEPSVIQQVIQRNNQEKEILNKFVKGYFMSAACYIMNRNGMKKFLDIMININPDKTYTYKADFSNPKAAAEEMLYRYINSYTLILPLFNTYENYKSNLSEEYEYMNRNYTNMCMINELYNRIDITNLFIDKNIAILPYDLHYISYTKSGLNENFVNRIYEDHKEYSIFLHSGLGNRLFQYCFAYALAKRNNTPFNVFYSTVNFQHSYSQYLDYFHIQNDSSYPQISTYKILDIIIDPTQSVYTYNGFNMSNIEYIDEKQEQKVSEYICDKNKTYIFNGFFQNEKYFLEYRDDILKLFPEPPSVTPLLNNLGNVFDNIVAIHVRLGDFVGLKQHFINLNTYYNYAITLAQRRCANVSFVIISDEPNCNTIYRVYPNLKDIPKLITQNKDEFVDLYFMTRCKGVICSNSTFSWWGAWLNQREDKFITIPDKFMNDRDDIIEMKGAHIISSYSFTV
jgi:GR25 family glycosyltransferase involved in LPS biosynthesis